MAWFETSFLPVVRKVAERWCVGSKDIRGAVAEERMNLVRAELK